MIKQEEAEKQTEVNKIRQASDARRTKVTTNSVWAYGTHVRYESIEPDCDTYHGGGGSIPGFGEWQKELSDLTQKNKELALAEAKKQHEAKEQAKAARNLERAKFAGLEDAWAKGYVTEEGLITAVGDKIRAKYGLEYEQSQLKYEGAFDLSKDEIETAEAFRAKLPEGAIVTLTGDSASVADHIVIFASWTEEGSRVLASALVRDEREDEDEDDE